MAAVIDADVSDLEKVRAAFQEAIDCMGSVDVLINNAGISIRHDFLDITPEKWDAVLGVNLTGIFNMAQTAAILRHGFPGFAGVFRHLAEFAGKGSRSPFPRGLVYPQRGAAC